MRCRGHFPCFRLTLTLLAMAALCSCQAGADRPGDKKDAADEPAPSPQVKTLAKIKLTSPAFDEGEPVPKKFTGEGEDVSPALAWSEVPEGTKQFALICDDPDAPRKEPWVHWVLYKIPPETRGLAEGIAKELIYQCLIAMKHAGYAYAVIGWVSSEEYYAKTCGAITIPDSFPGIYSRMISVD